MGEKGREGGGSLCEHNTHQTFDIQPFTRDSRDSKTRKKKYRHIIARHGDTHVAGQAILPLL